ncbi:ChaB family protein [Streptomyces zagrosensis]|uniref:Cation transport regulator ChaB n=1 Tax=Streptomyces zagrosensis TaxID=1042984 RepID=A0A7W9Q8D7_9ACTN|nr:ChaB family protein [Streptomyces zagrosensis]MBB5935494.1 cation transport regulator ChaB [Streptomyces zagrosensis]
MPGRQELPSTLERSPEDAQRTWVAAHASAIQEYGEGERTHRVAYGALNHAYEKVGDHWERKEAQRKGPSDPQSARPRQQDQQDQQNQRNQQNHEKGRSGEGVDEQATKQHLYEVARRLDVEGRPRMTKSELLEAIRKANRSRTREARD